jgi:hypothetical protein
MKGLKEVHGLVTVRVAVLALTAGFALTVSEETPMLEKIRERGQ